MTAPTRVEQLSGLIGAAAAVVGEVDLERVLRRLVIEARAATGARYAALGVIGRHGVLTDFIYDGLDADEARSIGHLPQGRGVLGTVVRERRTIRLDRISSHADSYGFPENHPPMTTFLGVPILSGASTFGNLYLTDKPGGFTPEDAELVEALGTIAGSAVSTARLRERLEAMAVVEDRNRIARDLHDSVIQDLFAIGLSIQGLSNRVKDEAASSILGDAVDRLDSAVEALRSYIYELKVSDDRRLTLESRLHDLADRMGSAYPIRVELDFDRSLVAVDPVIAEELIKLATEALSNALRHSSGEQARIVARRRHTGVELVVSDDGSGFDQEESGRGLGLINMRERVSRLGGEMEIESSPGSGTRVSIRLPLR